MLAEKYAECNGCVAGPRLRRRRLAVATTGGCATDHGWATDYSESIGRLSRFIIFYFLSGEQQELLAVYIGACLVCAGGIKYSET